MSDDPYLYPDTTVLRNNRGIKDQAKLDIYEQRHTTNAMKTLQSDPVKGRFDLSHMQAIHKRIFEKVYPFAGQIRTVNMSKAEEKLGGASVDYASVTAIRPQAQTHLQELSKSDWSGLKDMSKPKDMEAFANKIIDVWKDHPFREGNTRTTMKFMTQFAKERGFALDTELLGANAKFVRSSLVVGSLGDTKHLTRILTDARQREMKNEVERGDKLEAKLASPAAARDPNLKGMVSKLSRLEAELKGQGASKAEIAVSRKNAIQSMAISHRAGKTHKVEKLANTAPPREKAKDRGRER